MVGAALGPPAGGASPAPTVVKPRDVLSDRRERWDVSRTTTLSRAQPPWNVAQGAADGMEPASGKGKGGVTPALPACLIGNLLDQYRLLRLRCGAAFQELER
jgi:hypothetical protein